MHHNASFASLSPLVKGILFGLICAFIWAGWIILTSFGTKNHSLNNYDITALRFTTSGILFLPYLLKKGINIGPRSWLGILIMSLGAGPLYILFATNGMVCTSACHVGGLLPGTMPLFTACLSILILREKIPLKRIFGLLTIILGAFMLTGFNPFTISPQHLSNYSWLLLASISWSSFTIATRYWKVTALHAAALISVFSMLIYDPIYWFFLKPGINEAPLHEILIQTFYQGIIAGSIALICYGKAIEILGASRGAVFVALVPALVALMGIPFLGEWPSLFESLAILVLTFGVVTATGAKFRRKS